MQHLEVSGTCLTGRLTLGRTLEETAAIFDGKKEELELHEVGTVAATRSLHALRDEGILSSSTHNLTYPLPPSKAMTTSQKEPKGRPESSITASTDLDHSSPVRVV
jgi:hypothetical protein